MLTSGISFVNFKKKNKSLKIRKNLQSIINDKNEILNSLSNNYRDSYKKNLVNKSLLRQCFIIKIPNRIFFLILSPLILFSPRYYAAILRISVNMGGFSPSNKILGVKKNRFPLRIKK